MDKCERWKNNVSKYTHIRTRIRALTHTCIYQFIEYTMRCTLIDRKYDKETETHTH